MKENAERTVRTSPTAPARTSSSVALEQGMEAVHERFHQDDLRLLGRGEHRPDLGFAQGERFLAEDVLPRPGGPDRPLGVEVVGQGDVDGVDPGVFDELGVTRESAPDAVAARPVPGALRIAGGDPGRLGVPRLADGRDEGPLGDPGAAENAPAQLSLSHSRALYQKWMKMTTKPL